MSGYYEAEKKFKITYPCSVCGKPMVMEPGEEDHIAMKKYMKEHGWHHGECST
jgi:hypothetical protein